MRGALLVATAIVLAPAGSLAQQFRRPVECDSCIGNWYYFDEDGGGGDQDWNCGGSSYDGHRGSDFSLIGGNGAIDAGHHVVAVADGTVVDATDGFYDRCTACGGSGCGTDFGFGYGNHIVIDHGTRKTIYAHLRNGSVRVGVGDRVTCGQIIGDIGSSGCSTGAHLHLETRPIGGGYMTAYDPFMGACSPTSPSVFVDQGPYRGMPAPACDGMPPPPACPSGTYPIWTCNADRTARRRCIDGRDETEACTYGCIVMPVGVDDVCMAPPDVDSGPPPMPDAGPPPPFDAGTLPAPDGGASGFDAGAEPERDAGSLRDPPPPALDGGCGCRASAASGGALGWVPLLLAMAWLGRRRRSRR